MDDSIDGAIRLSVDAQVATIVIDRPAKHNAITMPMAAQLAVVCREVDTRDDVRVVLIRGGGERAFSAGSDLNALAEDRGVWAFRNRIEYAAVVRDIRKPVVALLHGWVLGGGLEIAMAADVRIAGRSAKLGAPEVTRGWLGGGGASQILPRTIGAGRAMHLLLSGDHVGADEALRIGLVSQVADDEALMDAALALAGKIAANPVRALRLTKRLLREGQKGDSDQVLELSAAYQAIVHETKDHVEAVTAILEKRAPSFTGD